MLFIGVLKFIRQNHNRLCFCVLHLMDLQKYVLLLLLLSFQHIMKLGKFDIYLLRIYNSKGKDTGRYICTGYLSSKIFFKNKNQCNKCYSSFVLVVSA